MGPDSVTSKACARRRLVLSKRQPSLSNKLRPMAGTLISATCTLNAVSSGLAEASLSLPAALVLANAFSISARVKFCELTIWLDNISVQPMGV